MIKKIWFKNKQETFFVTWSLHNYCNFRCTYCPDGLNLGSLQELPFENIIKFFNSLKMIAPNKKIIFAFSGGEPTYHPQFIEIIKFLSNNGCEITLTTNGSQTLKWWKEAEPYIDHLVISYHVGWTKKEKLSKVIEFLTKTTWVNLDFMMSTDNWDDTIEFSNSLKGKENLSISYIPIQQDFGQHSKGLINYTQEQLDFLQNNSTVFGKFSPSPRKIDKCKGFFGRGEKFMETDALGTSLLDYKYLISNKLNYFKGYECDLGLEGLIIEVTGEIYKAYCHIGGIVGNINTGELNFVYKPVICTKDICPCSVDIEISKRIKNE